MTAWHVDRGLGVLIADWKREHPGSVVGTIAGGGHTTVRTDHVPDAANSVDAADFMVGHGVTQAHLDDLFHKLIAGRDRRIAYVIRNATIVSSTVSPWMLRRYDGAYHGDHVHLSVNDKHAEDTSPWRLAERIVKMEAVSGHLPVLKRGDTDPIDSSGWAHVLRLQRALGIKDDGDYGPKTQAALATWLKGKGLPGDGSTVNVKIWRALFAIRA